MWRGTALIALQFLEILEEEPVGEIFVERRGQGRKQGIIDMEEPIEGQGTGPEPPPSQLQCPDAGSPQREDEIVGFRRGIH